MRGGDQGGSQGGSKGSKEDLGQIQGRSMRSGSVQGEEWSRGRTSEGLGVFKECPGVTGVTGSSRGLKGKEENVTASGA